MIFSDTKHAKAATGKNFFCLEENCHSRVEGLNLIGVIKNEKSHYLVTQEDCLLCEEGKLKAINLDLKHPFEHAVTLLLSTELNSTSELLKKFIELSSDFDHQNCRTGYNPISQKILSRNLDLIYDFIDEELNDITSELNYGRCEKGVYFEWNGIYSLALPIARWEPESSVKVGVLYKRYLDRREEYLTDPCNEPVKIKPTFEIKDLIRLNRSIYFDIESIFNDVQLSIEIELLKLQKEEDTPITPDEVANALRVLDMYKTGNITGKKHFFELCHTGITMQI